jgi:uncharacterized protein
MEKNKNIFIALIILTAICLHAFLVNRGIQRFKKEDRSISVKGFSEREVKSDMAVWTIECSIGNDDLIIGSRLIDDTKNKVMAFLTKNGIKNDEIILKDLSVNDRKAQEFINYNSKENFRFIISKIIQVRSFNVDNLQKVSRMTDDLLKIGIALNNRVNYGSNASGLRYYYTKLNEIKPSMLTEATKNAKSAAIQFANESNSKLGKLKKANQGLFTIVDRDEYLSNSSDGAYMPESVHDIYKKVRVVINVEYSIE